MKTTIATIFCSLLALSAFAQTPSPTAPPNFAATATPFAAAPAPVASPAIPAPPPPVANPTASATATATPANSVTLTVSTSSTPSADDAIDSVIEKKIRRHFDFASNRHHSGNDDDSSWIALPIVFIVFLAIFGMPVLIVAVILYFSFSKNRAMHKTVRMMVEKGQPVPEALLNPPPVVRQRSDLRRGIKWLLVGLGVMIFFGACNDWDGGAWSIGVIPFMIGVGYVIFWRLDLRQEPPSPRV
ncbi:MAG: hypothetical protein H0X34_06650 [Chthoniobacterales bacterium]|nr:hypothetical protein [Chthoniobacterales bacterium]